MVCYAQTGDAETQPSLYNWKRATHIIDRRTNRVTSSVYETKNGGLVYSWAVDDAGNVTVAGVFGNFTSVPGGFNFADAVSRTSTRLYAEQNQPQFMLQQMSITLSDPYTPQELVLDTKAMLTPMAFPNPLPRQVIDETVLTGDCTKPQSFACWCINPVQIRIFQQTVPGGTAISGLYSSAGVPIFGATEVFWSRLYPMAAVGPFGVNSMSAGLLMSKTIMENTARACDLCFYMEEAEWSVASTLVGSDNGRLWRVTGNVDCYPDRGQITPGGNTTLLPDDLTFIYGRVLAVRTCDPSTGQPACCGPCFT